MIHGLILARGGSKRVPDKNLMKIKNNTLIDYAIEKALNSRFIDNIYVSTEDEQIKQHVCEYKSSQIFIIDRPAELAQDDTPLLPVLQHAAQIIRGQYIMQICPCAPQFDEIDEMIENTINFDLDSVYAIKTQIIRDMDGESKHIKYYSTNMRCYKRESLLNANGFIVGPRHETYRIDDYIIDINTMSDFICAETLL